MWSAPRPFLWYGAVNAPKTVRDSRRRCFPWGPCKVVVKTNSVEQHRAKSRVSGRQPAGIWAWNWTESNLRNWQLQNNGKKGIRLRKEDFMCDSKLQWDWYNYCIEIRCQDTTSEDWEPLCCVTVNVKVCRSAVALYCLHSRVVWIRCQ
jgi:hypothetical protein